MYYDMQHMGSQARYASCTMTCSMWARRPDTMMYYDMQHMGSQTRYASCTMTCSMWARRPDMHHVLGHGSYGLADPICIMY
jgi:hypothetical protein